MKDTWSLKIKQPTNSPKSVMPNSLNRGPHAAYFDFKGAGPVKLPFV